MFRLVLTLLCTIILAGSSVAAQSSSSSNYRVDQTFFGSGGELDASSSSYRSKQTAGELAIGDTSSPNYRAWAGFNTTDDPYIEFVVTGDNIDLGYLDTATTKTANGTFYVRAWQSEGYTVRTESNPPTNTGPGAQQLTPMATQASSAAGSEQFGINLVENLSAGPCLAPTNFGQDPQQNPDGTFSFGQVDDEYNDCGQFKYNKGDRVAYSDESTSSTVYTVSYIFNIANATPSGQYDFNHVLVATGTY